MNPKIQKNQENKRNHQYEKDSGTTKNNNVVL